MRKSKTEASPEEIIQSQPDANEMPETKERFISWVKANKKYLIMTGVGITALVGVIMGLENKESLEALWASLVTAVKKLPAEAPVTTPSIPLETSMLESVSTKRAYTLPTETFIVRSHPRNLGANRHHSAAKAAEAAALGIELLPNQTLVKSYPKYVA